MEYCSDLSSAENRLDIVQNKLKDAKSKINSAKKSYNNCKYNGVSRDYSPISEYNSIYNALTTYQDFAKELKALLKFISSDITDTDNAVYKKIHNAGFFKSIGEWIGKNCNIPKMIGDVVGDIKQYLDDHPLYKLQLKFTLALIVDFIDVVVEEVEAIPGAVTGVVKDISKKKSFGDIANNFFDKFGKIDTFAKIEDDIAGIATCIYGQVEEAKGNNELSKYLLEEGNNLLKNRGLAETVHQYAEYTDIKALDVAAVTLNVVGTIGDAKEVKEAYDDLMKNSLRFAYKGKRGVKGREGKHILYMAGLANKPGYASKTEKLTRKLKNTKSLIGIGEKAIIDRDIKGALDKTLERSMPGKLYKKMKNVAEDIVTD